MECSLSNYAFKGPDGREYVWSLGNTTKVRGTPFRIDNIDDEVWIAISQGFGKNASCAISSWHVRIDRGSTPGHARDIRRRKGYVRYCCRYVYLYGNTACGRKGYDIGRLPGECGVAWCRLGFCNMSNISARLLLLEIAPVASLFCRVPKRHLKTITVFSIPISL